MRTFRDSSISQKLIITIVATTAASMLISGIGIFISDAYLFRRYMSRDLSALAGIIADNATAALTLNDPKAARDTLDSLRERSHIEKACIYRADGSELANYLRAGVPAGCPPASGLTGVHFTTQEVTVWRPIQLGDNTMGSLVLYYDLDELYERARMYDTTVVGVLFAASLLGLLFSTRLRTLITAPLSSLAQVAARVSATQDYSLRAEKHSSDELGVLVEGFNHMLATIQDRDNALLKAILDREQALRNADGMRDSLRTTLSSIGEAVISTDLDGRILFANRVAQSLLESSEAELTGRRLDEAFVIMSERNREPLGSPVRTALEKGSFSEVNDAVLIGKDGVETPIDFSSAPVRSDDGASHGAVIIFRDARARRKAEETSRLLASIVDSSGDAIIGHKLDGTITSWNQGARRIFGYTTEEMIGSHDSVLTAPGHLDDMPEILGRVRLGERVNQLQTIRRTKSGSVIDVWITVSPLYDASGRIIGASKIARDITEQVRAANYLASLNADLKRTNASLARSNEDLERFAFVASHDLQEPLRMIAIFTQLLLKDRAVPANAHAEAYASHIVEGARRMRELLADLLAFTEIGSPAPLAVAPVDLNVVLGKVRGNLEAAITESGALIAAEPLGVLNVSEGHFISLFQNLIGNAIKYRGDRPPEIRIFMTRNEGQLTFTVADNGIGIDPQYHEKIFVAFRRLHGRKIPGTGIGLAICQRIVERYGGNIHVDSTLGQGASFVFTLPETLLVAGQLPPVPQWIAQ